MATAGLALLLEGDAGAAVEDDVEAELGLELADELLLLLLPHAAIAVALSSDSAASSGFLLITIRLLLR